MKNTTTASAPTASHTPGPWQLSLRERTESFYGLTFKRREIYGTQSMVLIASVCGPELRTKMHAHAEFEANARLIAAAPELLAALRALVHPMASDDDVDHARAVIAAATTSDQT